DVTVKAQLVQRRPPSGKGRASSEEESLSVSQTRQTGDVDGPGGHGCQTNRDRDSFPLTV
ncbi:hypothetical protein FQA47_009222, partial [Oryzias melastigma]